MSVRTGGVPFNQANTVSNKNRIFRSKKQNIINPFAFQYCMKVILSRKGFDDENGGYPSPILPDGRLISLPIPSKDHIFYSDLKLDENMSYYDLMKGLKPTIKYDGKWHDLTKDSECHLDPDIRGTIIKRLDNWKPCFGQIGASQTHLLKQGISKDDLFLFFGTFRRTKFLDGKYIFDKKAEKLHLIFNYLQIRDIIQINEKYKVLDWMKYHPHTSRDRRKISTNAIYIAREKLSWNSNIKGAGCFRYNSKLVLTKKGYSKSRWNLPTFFKEAEISRHSLSSWKKEGYFRSVSKGQELVIQDNKKVENWARDIIKQGV